MFKYKFNILILQWVKKHQQMPFVLSLQGM